VAVATDVMLVNFWGLIMKSFTLFVFVVVVAGSNVAQAVVLTNATATYSQSFLTSNYLVSQSIDGITLGRNGWAVGQNTSNPALAAFAETAAFETLSNPAGGSGAYMTFTLTQNFAEVPGHTIGRFRLSVTGDDRTTFADGLQSGGDVTATWSILTPVIALATGGAILTVQGDNSILASGPSPATSVYTVSAFSTLTDITGVRLEVLEHASLPFQGPGRQPVNGNFVLTEFQMDATALPEPATLLVFGFVAVLALPLRKLAISTLRTC
jgi:hypothetical protein